MHRLAGVNHGLNCLENALWQPNFVGETPDRSVLQNCVQSMWDLLGSAGGQIAIAIELANAALEEYDANRCFRIFKPMLESPRGLFKSLSLSFFSDPFISLNRKYSKTFLYLYC